MFALATLLILLLLVIACQLRTVPAVQEEVSVAPEEDSPEDSSWEHFEDYDRPLMLEDIALGARTECGSFYGTRLDLGGGFTLSIAAEKPGRNGEDFGYSLALLRESGDHEQYVVTYADDEITAELAEDIQEKIDFDMGGILYGLSRKTALTNIRKIEAYIKDLRAAV